MNDFIHGMSKTPQINCHRCNGTGKIPLEYLQVEILQSVFHTGNVGITSDEVVIGFKHLNLIPSAFNNRLERLRSLGFIERRKDGKFWRYFKASTALKTRKPKRK